MDKEAIKTNIPDWTLRLNQIPTYILAFDGVPWCRGLYAITDLT